MANRKKTPKKSTKAALKDLKPRKPTARSVKGGRFEPTKLLGPLK